MTSRPASVSSSPCRLPTAIDHLELEGECELALGELALEEGDLAAARARFTRSLEVCRNAENKRGEAIALWWTGKAEAAGGDSEAARVKLGRGAARAAGLRDERGGARLPRGPCRAHAHARPGGRGGAPVRGRRNATGKASTVAAAASGAGGGAAPSRQRALPLATLHSTQRGPTDAVGSWSRQPDARSRRRPKRQRPFDRTARRGSPNATPAPGYWRGRVGTTLSEPPIRSPSRHSLGH